jgi:hypothetical protein
MRRYKMKKYNKIMGVFTKTADKLNNLMEENKNVVSMNNVKIDDLREKIVNVEILNDGINEETEAAEKALLKIRSFLG